MDCYLPIVPYALDVVPSEVLQLIPHLLDVINARVDFTLLLQLATSQFFLQDLVKLVERV